MDYETSSQARFWMFDELSLSECRTKAAVVQPSTKKRARSFACGYQNRINKRCSEENSRRMMPLDQETLVHFHAHQIQRLVGPNAIFPELQRSSSVLSTAIMLFRRFYLSNSVIDFHPRAMAAASALLAVKVDCERFLEVRLSLTIHQFLFGFIWCSQSDSLVLFIRSIYLPMQRLQLASRLVAREFVEMN